MISSIKTYLLVIVICVNAFSQDLPKDKTQKHIQVAGTNIFLVPPRSFSLSTNFKGFQNPDDQTSMIMIVEVPGPFTEVSKGMLKNRGMDLKSKKVIKVANFNG